MFDEDYKKILAKHLCLKNLSDLDSIVGEEEFKSITNRLDEISYKPGNKRHLKDVDSYDYCYMDSGLFCANLHAHTHHSDGLADVQTLLDNALLSADKNSGKMIPFVLAITDHDTLEGAKDAVKTVSSNPKKYKNLKIVLGIEISTVETKLSCIEKTLDIHTLLYCINPFDEVLNDFVSDKLNKKLKLAHKTLNNLSEAISDELKKLDIILTLEEASKIHPMITKGEDEVSHPLKKYIFSKLLFSYYLENNKELIQILKSYNVDEQALSYEKVVHKYKSMFNNEKYFFIYKDALEKYLNLLTDNKKDIKLEDIPQWLVDTLLKAKEICECSHPSPIVKLEAFCEFTDTVKFLSTLEYGLMSIAHPARINTKNINVDTFDFYLAFFNNFKKYGKDKSYAYEKYYQSYTSKKALENALIIDKAADLSGLKYTGGIDSHGYNVYNRSPYS